MTLEQLALDIKAEFPAFELRHKKDSTFMKVLSALLLVLTLGAQSTFMTSYVTTIGYTIYVPDSWDTMPLKDCIVLLRHERVHMRQRKKYGALLFSFLYLVPFFPLGLAYWRAKFEWEAYEETMRATYELFGEKILLQKSFRDAIVGYFTKGSYGWMWPFTATVQHWYAEAVDRIKAGK